MNGKLIVLGTPIGNLGDFSPRGVNTLKEADLIAAEDTRVTQKLLNYFGINKPMISYFEHNKRARGDLLIKSMIGDENGGIGKTCVLVSDAGMPLISDPGEDLIKRCVEEGISVSVVPGPSAITAAIAICGLKSGRFTFEGFLSVNKKARREHIEELKTEKRTMVFYEASHKLPKTLTDLFNAFGDRRIAIAREITKIYEEVIRTNLKEAAQKYSNEKLKGEIVLIIEGIQNPITNEYNIKDAVALAIDFVAEGHSKSEAAKMAACITKFKKSDIYKNLFTRS